MSNTKITEEAIKEVLTRIKKIVDESPKTKYTENYIEFEGMNCNDFLKPGEPECPGWDGYSRRCKCGNRRVYFEDGVPTAW